MNPNRPGGITSDMALSISHRRLAVAAGVGVLALGLAAGMTTMRPRDGAEARGPALQIALFTPPPPIIEPGSTMEVGDLTDGYVHRPAPRPQPIEWVEFQDGWWDVGVQDPPRAAAWTPASDAEPAVEELAEPQPETRRDSMGFGFESRAETERRVMRSAPPERTPPPQGGEAPPRVMVSGERQAVFY